MKRDRAGRRARPGAGESATSASKSSLQVEASLLPKVKGRDACWRPAPHFPSPIAPRNLEDFIFFPSADLRWAETIGTRRPPTDFAASGAKLFGSGLLFARHC